jgi:hypothetical protein
LFGFSNLKGIKHIKIDEIYEIYEIYEKIINNEVQNILNLKIREF